MDTASQGLPTWHSTAGNFVHSFCFALQLRLCLEKRRRQVEMGKNGKNMGSKFQKPIILRTELKLYKAFPGWAFFVLMDLTRMWPKGQVRRSPKNFPKLVNEEKQLLILSLKLIIQIFIV